MLDDIEIKDFHFNDILFVGELFNTHWRKDHIFFRCPEMLRWYCFDNPYARLFSNRLTVKGAYQDNELIGFFAYFPFLLNNYGKRAYGFHTAQWFSFPEHRGKSLGSKLLSSAWDNRTDICFALGNNDAARGIFKKWGWSFIDLWPRYILVLDKTIGPLASPSVEELPTIKHLDWDNFYWNEIAPLSISPAREKQYLLWRYENIPLFKYQYLATYHKGLIRGLLIYRTEKIATQEKIVRILEILSIPQYSGALLDKLIALSITEKVNFIDFFCTSRLYENALLDRGFIKDNVNNHYSIPFLFRPLDTITLTLDLAWKATDTTLNMSGLYLTKGDGFHDVPN